MGKKLSPEQIAAVDAAFNERYPMAKPQWSFSLSIVLDKPLDEVVSKLGGLDNFEMLSRLNPVCVEYTEAGRDEVVLPGPLEGARVRESPASSSSDVAEAALVEGGRKYGRINFRAKDRLTVFWGLLAGIVQQRGTFVWDEEKKLGLWEVTTTDTPGMETWARKLVRFVDAGDGKTRIEEFLEGYSKESLQIFEGLAKRYTRNLHKYAHHYFKVKLAQQNSGIG
ncbi:hypothetical protein P691DRAFT_754697 [Macrolepiota fuliginosa MF-IS2]|uniref:Uncharacterized protein n=1 Tax=Macrolepiota fuliginosa MF-IS2 TaxID=1400762 RepID=A0A9P5XRJ0_9AGAR|nr:hypothetical protein P691DRAFT_754697 [Macrolepiota fuliginosa MF-IS2]